MTNTTIETREIPSLPGYLATSEGQILKVETGRTLKSRPRANGYLHVQPFVDGKQERRAVHRLVAEAFLGRRPEGHHTRHLNGVKEDCSIVNLCYGTPKQNHEDCVRHGRAISLRRGADHPASKISEETAEDVKHLAGIGERYGVIAKQFNITPSLVGMIARGKVWKHLPGSISLRELLARNQQKRHRTTAAATAGTP